MSRVVPPPIEKNQNETGTTLSFFRSEAIHCTRKRLEKNAWPRNPTVQKAALGLAFLLFKILEASLGRPFPELAEPRLLDAYAGTQAWLRQWEGAPPVEVLQALGQAEHASLAAYILEIFYAGGAVP